MKGIYCRVDVVLLHALLLLSSQLNLIFYIKYIHYNCGVLLPPKTAILTLTLKDVLELVLLQGSSHHLLDGTDVLVEFDHQGVIVHAGSIGHNGIVALFGQGYEMMEAVNSKNRINAEKKRNTITQRSKLQNAVRHQHSRRV